MSSKQKCRTITRQGRVCRNQAMAGSDPPTCWRHLNHRKAFRVPDRAATSKEEAADCPQAPAVSNSLANELAVVRLVLQRLVDQLDKPEFALEADELRKLAALIFSGARTVAYLLQQQSGCEADGPDWLNQALDALSAEFEVEL